ncbi:yeats-domain-containing protein, partial [Ascodesmis nigricans]
MVSASQTKRVKGYSVYRPIVYGNEAHPLPPDKRPTGAAADHTHQWTISVKGINDTDISYFIKKVQFKLHAESYTPAIRTIETAPFQVTETGWGEFEIAIKLYFHPESNEKPLQLFHYLKLHPYIGTEAELEAHRLQGKSVTSYSYDEVVFNEPTEAMFEVLTNKGTARVPPRARGAKGEFVEETERMELDKLGAGLRKVKEQTDLIKQKALAKEKEVAELRRRLEE